MEHECVGKWYGAQLVWHLRYAGREVEISDDDFKLWIREHFSWGRRAEDGCIRRYHTEALVKALWEGERDGG